VKTEGIGDFTDKSIGDQFLVPAHPFTDQFMVLQVVFVPQKK